MAQARVLTMKNKEIKYSEVKLEKLDKWLGIKIDENYTNFDLANARFKASYAVLYTLIGLSFIMISVLIYMSKGTNGVLVELMVVTVIYGLFTFIFHQNRDALMMGILALIIAVDKVFIIITTQRISGITIVVIGFLLMASVTAFKAYNEMDTKSNKVLKLIARVVFMLLIILAIVGLTLV